MGWARREREAAEAMVWRVGLAEEEEEKEASGLARCLDFLLFLRVLLLWFPLLCLARWWWGWVERYPEERALWTREDISQEEGRTKTPWLGSVVK